MLVESRRIAGVLSNEVLASEMVNGGVGGKRYSECELIVDVRVVVNWLVVSGLVESGQRGSGQRGSGQRVSGQRVSGRGSGQVCAQRVDHTILYTLF
jgi:hypothetical protein